MRFTENFTQNLGLLHKERDDLFAKIEEERERLADVLPDLDAKLKFNNYSKISSKFLIFNKILLKIRIVSSLEILKKTFSVCSFYQKSRRLNQEWLTKIATTIIESF